MATNRPRRNIKHKHSEDFLYEESEGQLYKAEQCQCEICNLIPDLPPHIKVDYATMCVTNDDGQAGEQARYQQRVNINKTSDTEVSKYRQ